MSMDKVDIKSKLFNSSTANSLYKEHYIEQYRLYVNSCERVSDRRQRTNEFFLGLNVALLTALGFIVSKFGETSATLVYFALIAGIVVCYFWYRIINSYKGLNTGKFKIVHIIESKLPLSLYDAEWDILGRGKDKKVYWPFSHIEVKIPWVFIFLYVVILVMPFLSKITLLLIDKCIN